jgi:hypothetical protein
VIVRGEKGSVLGILTSDYLRFVLLGRLWLKVDPFSSPEALCIIDNIIMTALATAFGNSICALKLAHSFRQSTTQLQHIFMTDSTVALQELRAISRSNHRIFLLCSCESENQQAPNVLTCTSSHSR